MWKTDGVCPYPPENAVFKVELDVFWGGTSDAVSVYLASVCIRLAVSRFVRRGGSGDGGAEAVLQWVFKIPYLTLPFPT